MLMVTFGASRNMPTERGSAARFNRGHHSQLGTVQVPSMFLAIGIPMGTVDICDLQFGTGHLSPA